MTERIIIGMKRGAKAQPSLGLISAIAEEVDGKLFPITEENFCITKEVFVVNGYDEIEEKFRDNELFQIRVELNQQNQSGPCKYKTSGRNAQKLQPNDIAEIIHTNSLPDRNIRLLNVKTLPVTKYILIQTDAGDCYGPFDWEDKSKSQDETAIELKIITSGRLGEKSGGEKRRICKFSGEKINSSAVNCEYFSFRKRLVSNISTVISGATFEEYANDKEIIEEIKKMAGESVGQKIDRKVIELLSNFAKKNKEADHLPNKSRIALFNKIATSNADILNDINDLIESYLKNPSGVNFIEDYIQRNKEKYIDKLKSDKKN